MNKILILKIAVFALTVVSCNTLAAQMRGSKLPWTPRFLAGSHAANKVETHQDHPNHALYFRWDGATWDTAGQHAYTYYPNGNLLSMTFDQYINGQFRPRVSYSYTYNAADQMTEEVKTKWLGASWVNDYRISQTYDVHGNPLLNVEDDWSGSQWYMVKGASVTYVYDSQSRMVAQWDEHWAPGSGWQNGFMATATYDANQEVDTVVISYWDQNAWNFWERLVDFTYHNYSLGQLGSMTLQAYDTLGNWNSYMRSARTYSQYDSYEAIYETYSGTWNLAFGELFSIDQYGHQFEYDSYNWTGGWTYVNGNRNLMTYDGLGRTVENVYQRWDGFGFANWEKMVYDGYFVEVEGPILSGVSIYPNPVQDQLAVRNMDYDLIDFSLYDNQGRLVARHCVGRGNTAIDVALIARGLYTYRAALPSGEQVRVGALVKQ